MRVICHLNLPDSIRSLVMERYARYQKFMRIDMCLSVCRARSSVRTQPDDTSVSIAMLNRHIHTLRRRIRHFEERFEQEKHYKVTEGMRAAWEAGFVWVMIELKLFTQSEAMNLCVAISTSSYGDLRWNFFFLLFFVCLHAWLCICYVSILQCQLSCCGEIVPLVVQWKKDICYTMNLWSAA